MRPLLLASALTLACSAPVPHPSPSPNPISAPLPPSASTSSSPPAPAPSTPTLSPPPLLPALAGGGPRSITSSRGLVVSAEPNATRAGVSVLEAGGNAVDAAVATALALAVTHPSAGNLGGGGFALIRPRGGPTVALDFRETAPSSLTRADFDRMIAAKGSGPVAPGVPGTVAGLLLAERRFGKLPLERVFAPAIALARDGVVVGREQAALLASHWAALRLDRQARATFAGEHGAPVKAGARLKQPRLAAALEGIAALGDAGFYAGASAQSLVEATQGRISLSDLSGYRAIVREPLRVRYRGFELETMPPPSAGGLVLAGTLLALERLLPSPPPSEDASLLHTLLELERRAQALRRFHVVDPDVLDDAGRRAMLGRFLDPGALVAVPVDPAHATPSTKVHPLYADALRELEHTTHLSVVDADGMVVSLTTTLSASFGSKIMVAATGVLLGNAVASFGSNGDNQPAPGQRTTSSMAPTLVLSGRDPVLVLGTPGGDTIPSTLSLLVARLVDQRMPLDAAVDAPRLHHGFVPDAVRYEAARPPAAALLGELKTKGHRLLKSWASQGDASVLAISGGTASGYADPREGPGLALAPGAALAPAATP
jgi:gamma-glutamyltranspeptidase/glutathione hydrolase